MLATCRILILAVVLVSLSACDGPERRISVAQYEDKVYANLARAVHRQHVRAAHEWQYKDEPRTEPITGWADSSLKRMGEVNGAFSDDDTTSSTWTCFCMRSTARSRRTSRSRILEAVYQPSHLGRQPRRPRT